MEPPQRPTFHPMAAGGILTGTTGAGIAVGAGIGWLAGSWPLGALGGALVGIPAGIGAVYRRYRGAFS
jgi:F0F1-type ATP synthase assembly protein I